MLLAACAGGASSAPRGDVARGATADTAAASRARALALVARSLRALGVRDTARAPNAFEITLEARQERANPWQARRWTDSVPLQTPTTLRYLADLDRRRVMYELHSPAPGDIWFRYLTRYDSSAAWQVDLLRWRLGTDIVRGGAPLGRGGIATAERLLPHAALRQAARNSATLRATGTRTRDGRAVDVVAWVDSAVRQPVSVELDAATHLPVAIATPGNAEIELLDYRRVDGVLVPFRRVQRANGQRTGEQRVVSVTLRPRFAESRFTIPAGYTDPPPAGQPRATPLAEGVYRVDGAPGGYHAAFVVGDSGVMVLEAPTSAQFSDTVIRLIGSVAPGRAITHVFVTHHHSDHVGGMATYAARGAAIVVGAGLEEAVRRQLPDTLRARARFIPVKGGEVFGSGATRVVALPIANEHAEGNVAYYVAAPRILFQGDLFYIPERGPVPPAFPVTAALMRVVRACAPEVRTVVGVHGRTGTIEEVHESMRLAGLSADTVTRVACR